MGLDVVQKCYQMDWLDRDIGREQLVGAGILVMTDNKETNGLASPIAIETSDDATQQQMRIEK